MSILWLILSLSFKTQSKMPPLLWTFFLTPKSEFVTPSSKLWSHSAHLSVVVLITCIVDMYMSACGKRATSNSSAKKQTGRWKQQQLTDCWISFLVFINHVNMANLLLLKEFLHLPNGDDNTIARFLPHRRLSVNVKIKTFKNIW